MQPNTPPNQNELNQSAVTNTPSKPKWWSRLRRLTRKELRETLRDRRTIITLVLMPLLVYPILSLVFRTILISTLEDTLGNSKPVVLDIAFESNREPRLTKILLHQLAQVVDGPNTRAVDRQQTLPEINTDDPPAFLPATDRTPKFGNFLEHHWFQANVQDGAGNKNPDETQEEASNAPPKNPSNDEPATLTEAVLGSNVDVGVRFHFPESGEVKPLEVSLIRRTSVRSTKAAAYIEDAIRKFNKSQIAGRLQRVGISAEDPVNVLPMEIATDPNAPPSTSTFSLASLIPLVLVLMTVTGAVYPAIDLTAGERERGTLETLMAAPVPKVSILLAKFFAVWTVAIFTAVLNLVGMAATVWTFQFEKILLGPGGFSIFVILKIFGLLVLFAAFFSALMLAVTSFARSFKEAQAYLIPIILLSMGPGLLAMNPNLALNGIFAVTPMVNVLLLGRDVINQNVQWIPALVAIGSTLLYALVAIQFAANRFGANDVLYANQGSLGELIARPKTTQSHFTLAAAMMGLVLLLPINLVAIGFLGRMAKALEGHYSLWALMMMAFTAISFFGVPWTIAVARRVSLKSGFAAGMPRGSFWLPAVLLGLFMWPILATFVDQWYHLTAFFEGADAAKLRHDKLIELTQNQVEKFRQLPVVVVALAFSIVPAVCEEWFFRGMLLQTLIKKTTAWKAILISAALFGFFHTLSNSAISMDRLLPTTLMGVLLGYVCYRSQSIWPGAVLHMLHNGCLVFLGYFQPQLSQLSWFPAEGESIPLGWVIPAAVISMIAIAMVAFFNRRSPRVTATL